MVLCRELYIYLGIKAMSLCVIVSQFEDKSDGVTYKEQTRKRIALMRSSYQNNQKEARFSILLKSQGISIAFYFVALCKQKDIKKGCFYERSIPNFRDNKKITIKYYSVI